ncbi:MAG TPA: hypothetical protein VF049_17970 [Nocardioidaceae bacterium]|jgi:hypothetical protein
MINRTLAAAGTFVSGLVHLWLWFDGFRDISVVGPLFLLNAIAGVAIAVALLAWRQWLPLFLAAGFGATTLAAFLISTTVGLFGVHEVFWGTSQVAAGIAEIVAMVAGGLGLWLENRHRLAGHRGGGSVVQGYVDPREAGRPHA